MFGLTFEKLLVVLVLAAVIVGPHRLPLYAQRLGAFLRGIRAFVEATRTRLETEVGATLAVDEWRSLDPRQYDPRRIVREALAAPSTAQDAAEKADPDAEHAHPSRASAADADARIAVAATAIDGPVTDAETAVAAAARPTRSGGGGIGDLIARGVAARAPAAETGAADGAGVMPAASSAASVREPGLVAVPS